MSTDSTEDEVSRQYAAFLLALPSLLRSHAGKWVVWHGALRGVFENEDDAERWALKHLPRDAGFVIAPVEEPRTVPLSGLSAFRFAQ
jgi:hypothetical protein